MTEYLCPFCLSTKNSSNKKFETWASVEKHSRQCAKNNKEFYIDKIHGPISSQDLQSQDFKIRFPGANKGKIAESFRKKGISVPILTKTWTNEKILDIITNFTKQTGKIPICTDFSNNPEFPDYSTVADRFGSWNNAIAAAGFTPSASHSFGIRTYGLDGHLYRSKAEAYFSDNYLFNSYDYQIEPKYPLPYYKFYDWYIPVLDLYIELTGGLRPEITKEKIEINNLLSRNCIFISTSDIYKRTLIIKLLTQAHVSNLSPKQATGNG